VSEGGVSSTFQPMNANFGVIAPLEKKVKGGKKFRNEAYGVRSLKIIDSHFKMFGESNNENTN
jgi:folate-dependent tRNA-U54 methylase TrmFO/GidA